MIINDAVETILLPPTKRAKKKRLVFLSFRDEKGGLGHIASDVIIAAYTYPQVKPFGDMMNRRLEYYYTSLLEDFVHAESVDVIDLPRPDYDAQVLRVMTPLSKRSELQKFLKMISQNPTRGQWQYPFFAHSVSAEIRDDIRSLFKEVDVHPELLAVFEEQKKAELALNEYYGLLERTFPENRMRNCVRKTLEAIIDDEVPEKGRSFLDKNLSPELEARLIELRRGFLAHQEKTKELMNRIDPAAQVFEYNNQEWHALLVVSNILKRQNNRIEFLEYDGRPLIKVVGFNPAIFSWSACYGDIETCGFSTRKKPTDEWVDEVFIPRYLQGRNEFSVNDIGKEERARILAETKEYMSLLRETITHIGFLFSSENGKILWQGTIYEQGSSENAELVPLRGKIYPVAAPSFRASDEDVQRFYEGLEKNYLSRWRTAAEDEKERIAAKVMERFGIELNDKKERKHYELDIRCMLSQLSMQLAAVREFFDHDPFRVVFQNGPFDIQHMKKTHTILAAAKSFGIDVSRYLPKVTGIGHPMQKDPARSHVRIPGHLYIDTMILAKHCLPDCERRNLEAICDYFGIPLKKSMESGNINPANRLMLEGDAETCKEMAEYHRTDLVVLEELVERFAPQLYALTKVAQAFDVCIEDLLAERDRMQTLWDRKFRQTQGILRRQPGEAQKQVELRKKFRDIIKCLYSLDSETRLWDPNLSEREYRNVHVAHIPRAYFLREIILRVFPEAKEFLEEHFTLNGETQSEQEIQTVYARYMRALIEPLFYDSLELQRLNDRYEFAYRLINWSREDARELHTAARSRRHGFKRISSKYQRSVKSLVNSIERLCSDLSIAVKENESKEVAGEYSRHIRNNSSGNERSLFDESILLERMHPEIRAVTAMRDRMIGEETRTIYNALMHRIRKYKEACCDLEKECPYAWQRISEMGIKPEDFMYLHVQREELSRKSQRFCETYHVERTDEPKKLMIKGYERVRSFFERINMEMGARIIAQKGDRVFFIVNDDVPDDDVRKAVANSGCLTYQRKRDVFEVKHGQKNSNGNVINIFS